jgi:hypothetical protein
MLMAAAAQCPSFAGSPVVDTKAVAAPVEDWRDNTIEPVFDPLYFEDPTIRTEIRPIFIWHNINSDFITHGGDVQVYAVQARVKLTDRLAFIATEDGYIDMKPSAVLPHTHGWADIALGFKYALIDNPANQFILTPGFKVTIPTGSQSVFQGNGSGVWDLFVSAEKGFGNLHTTGNIGFRVPNDMSADSTIFHWDLQADYYACQWFIPFVGLNGTTVIASGNRIPLSVEGSDLINFGSSLSGGATEVIVAAGFRSRLHKNVDIGFAYQKGLTEKNGLFDDRFTVDAVIHF